MYALSISAAVLLVAQIALVSANTPGTSQFQRTWERTDKPVADGSVARTWMWGPQGNTGVIQERYDDAPGGVRNVQYFDKSRMEDNSYRGEAPWDVTNGLLVMELVTGRMQVGDNNYLEYQPSQHNIAGDADDRSGPTYAAMQRVLNAPAHGAGQTLAAHIDRNGVVSTNTVLAGYGVTAAHLAESGTGAHQVASPFWAFMNSTAKVWENGRLVDAPLFQNPFYATGLPITEGYWATVKVDGTVKDVLIQCFERRCLTYTPSNDATWRVEAGNVGQHYFAWRQEMTQQPEPTQPTATQPAATNTPAPTATPAESSNVGVDGGVSIPPRNTPTLTADQQGNKYFSVRPTAADAWICITNNVAGQSGKPGQFNGECIPNWYYTKGQADGGQGSPLRYAGVTLMVWDDAQNLYVPRSASAPPVYFSADFYPNTNTVVVNFMQSGDWTPTVIDPDTFAVGGYTMIADGVTVASPANTTCTDLYVPGTTTLRPGIHSVRGDNLTGADFLLFGIGDNLANTGPENATIEFRHNGTWYCAQLEPGTIQQQTPSQLASSIGGLVLVPDGNGEAAINLRPGCYNMAVSAEGYVSESEVECLRGGERYENYYDLESEN